MLAYKKNKQISMTESVCLVCLSCFHSIGKFTEGNHRQARIHFKIWLLLHLCCIGERKARAERLHARYNTKSKDVISLPRNQSQSRDVAKECMKVASRNENSFLMFSDCVCVCVWEKEK